jgi:hypothetical protein
MTTWRERIADRLFGDVIARRVHEAVQVVDDEYWSQIQGGHWRSLDRDWQAHRENLQDALEAWRSNPLARRIVSLCSDYVIGSGIVVRSGVPWVERFLSEFWTLNGMQRRLYDWCDELTRSGELFIVLRTDPASGMGFVRAIPAVRIVGITTDANDFQREINYRESSPGSIEGRPWPSYAAQPRAEQVMLHYAINRPVGCVRGSGDLEPILPWLKRYSEWLLNRARLNKYKTAFLWDVKVSGRPGRGDTVRKKRFRYRTPPQPGSIIVHGDDEEWSAVSPRIEAWDAKEDGKALRLAIASGAGIPLHFLAEGESATRATAAEMGDPTFRHYYRRQLVFGELLSDLCSTVVRRANAVGRGRTYADLKLEVQFPDVTKSDNQALAQSAQWIAQALEGMARLGIVDRETAITMAMKFAGELIDVKTVMERLEKNGPIACPNTGGRPTEG